MLFPGQREEWRIGREWIRQRNHLGRIEVLSAKPLDDQRRNRYRSDDPVRYGYPSATRHGWGGPCP
jgi:hypothetical protein